MLSPRNRQWEARERAGAVHDLASRDGIGLRRVLSREVSAPLNPSEELRRARQLAGLVAIFSGYNLCRRAGQRLDPEGELEHRVAHLAARHALDFLRIEVVTQHLERVRGLERYCVIANHASYLDWALLLGYFPAALRFVAKRELTHMPVIGGFLRSRGILIDRARGQDAKAAIRAAVTDGQPYPIAIFPEGTRTRDGALQPFKRGGLRVLAGAGRTFVPVSLRGTYEALPRHGRAVPAGSRLELIVGEPLRPHEFAGPDELIAACETQLQELYRGEEVRAGRAPASERLTRKRERNRLAGAIRWTDKAPQARQTFQAGS